jgi:hypothetical protein
MSPSGVAKRSESSTVRRQRTALKIKVLGRKYENMGRCTPCQNANVVCFMLDGYASCNNCTRRNRKDCDGVFSDAEFEALTAKRNRLAEAARQKGEEIRQKSEEMQRLLSSIAQANTERERLEKEAELLLEKQKRMVIQEANALDALDHVDPPAQASSTVMVGMDDGQLEEYFGLAPGSMADYLGPIPFDRPLAR